MSHVSVPKRACVPSRSRRLCRRCEDTPTPDRAGQGWTDLVFTESAPYSTPSEIYKHSGYADNAAVYDVTKEHFRVLPAPDINSPPVCSFGSALETTRLSLQTGSKYSPKQRLMVVAPLNPATTATP
jgi:hypothetical protein